MVNISPLVERTPGRVARLLASRVRALRLHRAWSQAELAGRAGLSPETVKRFERTGRITLESLLLLAVPLNALDDFLALFPEPPARSLDELEARARGPRRQRGRTLRRPPRTPDQP